MSGAAEAEVTPPYGMRRPSISTRVRGEPRPRRFRVAVPVAAFARVTFCAAKACGSWLTRSSMRVTPCVTTSAAVTCVTGVVDSRFAERMREPVTTISPRLSCASAGAAPAAVSAPMTSARRTADATWYLRSIAVFLPRAALAARLVARDKRPFASPDFALLVGNNRAKRRSVAWGDLTAAGIRKTGTWQIFPAVRKFCGTNCGVGASHVAECQRPERASSNGGKRREQGARAHRR